LTACVYDERSEDSPQNDEIVVNGKKNKTKPFDWSKLVMGI